MLQRQFPKAKGCFYEVKAAVRAEGEPTATDIWIYDVIGDDWFDPSLTAKELCQKIVAIETPEIVLHFNSPGGSVSDGVAIYNALRTHPATVTSLIEGWTGSIATVVALAADSVRMFDNTMFMIHNPWGVNVGNAREMREYADYLDRVGDLMSKVYLERCTKPEGELQEALDAETYLTAEQAAEWGFVDAVLESRMPAAACDSSVLESLGYRSPNAIGRTLSAANEAKLRSARDEIDEVLAQLEDQQEEEPDARSGDAPATMDTAGLASLLTTAKRH
jgi:ATP-dependent Clp endopeptidase proteolytic subunit ClpP